MGVETAAVGVVAVGGAVVVVVVMAAAAVPDAPPTYSHATCQPHIPCSPRGDRRCRGRPLLAALHSISLSASMLLPRAWTVGSSRLTQGQPPTQTVPACGAAQGGSWIMSKM
jgi:hypothetical protein